MSTQHPDNVAVPFFASSPVLAGEDEIREAFYAFSYLGCDEQMWDVEGKEIDTFIVRKLLAFYPQYFQEHVLGEDVRLTLRVPNPAVEKAEAKVLLETLESIPRSYDAAQLFYNRDVAPIFEVILPMTTSARCIERVYRYFADHIVARQHLRVYDNDITIAEWVGRFAPARIQVIPLFEDIPSLLAAPDIVAEYLADKKITDQRVFLAFSDPAMNYGLVSTALANKIALMRLAQVSAQIGVRLHPIMGMGSAPFRGGLTPTTVGRVSREYPSVVTFTIQSAFKYDFPVEQVRAACEWLKKREIGSAPDIPAERALRIIDKYSATYQRRIAELAPSINRIAKYIPSRRTRKLHIGLFGYARGIGGVTLPRAITFTAALYSLGLPPELIGFDALEPDDLSFIREVFPSFEAMLSDALRYTDFDGPLMTRSLRNAIDRAGICCVQDAEHIEIVRWIRAQLDAGDTSQLTDLVVRAALRRKFLG
ncbi:MAG: phosphoenolpyruvate carboxylase [Verrucomicrobiae bacterium]|nr:phosphoenolpyruvate carboxylase [Verrucomicrobiae bacterium]MCX7721604.1 phosphoenolpyruvate carboxylase [Verrucomicrobiae bacterium]MDW7979626.1 phosphoenolpyruvate carboxylase [Verrucomicrobiales bacterium]